MGGRQVGRKARNNEKKKRRKEGSQNKHNCYVSRKPFLFPCLLNPLAPESIQLKPLLSPFPQTLKASFFPPSLPPSLPLFLPSFLPSYLPSFLPIYPFPFPFRLHSLLTLTFSASSPLTLLRAFKARSSMVAMLSNGFLVTWMNFIGTLTTSRISSRMLNLSGSRNREDVAPPFLSPMTLHRQKNKKKQTKQN